MNSLQELFDAAYTHALSMPELARIYRNTASRYRAPNGQRCLIGAMIPDELYSPEMEDLTVNQLCFKPEFRPIMINIGLIGEETEDYYAKRITFLSELQQCHDAAKSVEDMFVRLEQLRNQYNLQLPTGHV